ncbi:MAG: hypothetical protein FD155_1051 [Bacteroidetes bacterium]|nr:MAG: hypothetical protein FD155_1051 [Bacteroidota bacterium]
MKNNRLAILLTSGLLLIAVFLILNQRSTGTLSKDAEFAVYDTSSVTKIFIAGMDDREVLLEREPNGWKLNKEFKAQQRKVSDLLNTMMKLRVRTPVAQAAHDNVITRMAGIAVKVEVYQVLPRINLFDRIKLFPRETRSLVYYVGDSPKDNMGTFMLKEGAETAYIMQITGFKGFLSTRYSPIADDWRDHTVFNTNLGDIRSVEVEFNEDPTKSYSVTRSDRHNYLLKRIQDQYVYENYDTLRLLNFLTAFSDIRFEALLNNLPQQRIDSIVNSPFLHRVTLTDEKGMSYSITTFTKKKLEQNMVDNETLQPVDLDRMYALVNDGRDFVLIQYFVFDKVLRPVTYFEPGSPEL